MTTVVLDQVVLERGPFRLEADAVFSPGLHVIVGRIGTGKSTLALALAGGLAPVSGGIRLMGISRSLWVGQSPEHHLTGATVEGEVASWSLPSGPLLERLGLADRVAVDPFRLSRGEQQRLVLGCALATNADLLVLDEPFAPLDIPSRIALGRALGVRHGVTIVTTHTDCHLPPAAVRWRIDGGRLGPEEA